MKNLNADIDEEAYMRGAVLYDALWAFGLTELIEEYETAYEDIAEDVQKPLERPDTVWDGVSQALSSFQKIGMAQSKQKEILSALKDDILDLIKEGDLTAYGYKQPRDIQDKPVKIPADLFSSGEINWENSELISQNLEFASIRLLENRKPELTVITEFPKNNNYGNKKPGKRNVFELPLDSLINEKEAGEFLGISHRTLQKYRSKGGGPEFNKIGRSVKYKIADLIKWRDENEKRNTSEY